MSEKMTRIRLPKERMPDHPYRIGLLDWGEKTFEEMVSKIKQKAEFDLKCATAILEAAPEDFEVDIVRGSIVQHWVRKVERK